MLSTQQQLQRQIEAAATELIGASPALPLLVAPTNDLKFGDLQCSNVLGLAKLLKRNPRELAQQIVARLDVSSLCEPPEIAGAGFINFRLKPDWIARQIATAAHDERVGVPPTSNPRTIVMDFSAPNVAKSMHVGHIRSTILGDALARLLRFLGHRVTTDNHIGDWGTQFGMLIIGWKKHRDEAAMTRDPIAELERLYRLVHQQCEADETVRDEARRELAKLQEGDADNLAIWETMRRLSQQQFDAIYQRLGVTFDHTLGESFYNPRLKKVVAELKSNGIAEDSEGAVCVFFPDRKELKDKPFLIQKSDGAALYATTDLATLEYRIEQWHPDEIIYVTDARQQLHFQQLFATAGRWLATFDPPPLTRFRHVCFGSILGENGKPLKTRTGENVKLAELLDEAESRARTIVDDKNEGLAEAVRKDIARVVGIGAVKYADLSQNRITDYTFSWDKMLAMQGNTAPYLQYAYVRIRSIFRKGKEQGSGFTVQGSELKMEHAAELDLAKHLLNFDWALQQVADDYKPNFLCNYLYELSGKFSTFYEGCPVLQSAEPTRSSRLILCQLTAAVLKKGLNLLGIETIEQM